MALSYLTESEAPRDFRVSSTESDGHYKKCLLCYTVKKNFYCPDCIRAGNFVPSSMPYSDRFSEKQAKLLRIKANRKHVLERCEKLLAPKMKQDTLITETKQSRDRIDLLRLAIEQRRRNIDEKKKQLSDLMHYNTELRLKLPRYQKRVSSLGKHTQMQRIELQNKASTYNDQTQALAALRRSRIRQLTKYIFPVYITYDSSDSIEDMEFVGDDILEEPPKKAQLHIVAPWINTDGDFSDLQSWVSQNRECVEGSSPLLRCAAALSLAAQMAALLAATLHVRLPHSLSLNEYCVGRASVNGVSARCSRVCACVAALCARTGLPPPQSPGSLGSLSSLHSLVAAAQADDSRLGAAPAPLQAEAAASWQAWQAQMPLREDREDDNDAEPEHLQWPDDNEMDELSSSPAAPPPASLVTSAAASIVSMWRGWTK